MGSPTEDDPLRRAMTWIAGAAALSFATVGLANQNDPRLGSLFDRLKAAPSAEEAADEEQAIWRIWHESGSAEIDALMMRGLRAMGARDLPEALAAFDEMVRKAPRFAEAWNKRRDRQLPDGAVRGLGRRTSTGRSRWSRAISARCRASAWSGSRRARRRRRSKPSTGRSPSIPTSPAPTPTSARSARSCAAGRSRAFFDRARSRPTAVPSPLFVANCTANNGAFHRAGSPDSRAGRAGPAVCVPGGRETGRRAQRCFAHAKILSLRAGSSDKG